MLDYLLLFFVAKAESVYLLIILGIFLSFVFAFVFAGISMDTYQEKDKEKFSELSKKTVKIACIFLVLFLLVPNREQLMIIVGGKLAIDVVKSNEVTETSKKIYQLLQKKLDSELQEKAK